MIEETRSNARDCWRSVVKPSDETRNSTTTLTADSDLKFRMEANRTYAIEAVVHYVTGATPDFKFGHSGPTSPTRVRVWRYQTVQGGTTEANVGIDAAYNTAGLTTGSASSGSGAVNFSATIVNGSTAGDFAFTWAQNTSDASNTTVEKGSWISYAEIP